MNLTAFLHIGKNVALRKSNNFLCKSLSLKRGAVYSICNLKYITPKEIPVVFRNESDYDYSFHKRASKDFEKELDYIGENSDA